MARDKSSDCVVIWLSVIGCPHGSEVVCGARWRQRLCGARWGQRLCGTNFGNMSSVLADQGPD